MKIPFVDRQHLNLHSAALSFEYLCKSGVTVSYIWNITTIRPPTELEQRPTTHIFSWIQEVKPPTMHTCEHTLPSAPHLVCF
jgi:hypothetical protein